MEQENLYFIKDELENFKTCWEEGEFVNYQDALDSNDIWDAEDDLRSICDYPTFDEEYDTIESWENEDNGAYVSAEAYVDYSFIQNLFKIHWDPTQHSIEELAEQFFTWAANHCYLKLSGDLWSDELNKEIKWVSYNDYLDGWTPEWIFSEDY